MAQIILIFSAVVNLFLGWLIYFRSSRRPVYRWYTVLSTFTSLWISLNLLTGWLQSIWIFRATYSLGAVLPALVYLWYKHFRERVFVFRRFQIVVMLLACSFTILPFIDGAIVLSANSFFLGGISGELGPAYPLWASYVFVFIFSLLYIITKDYRHSTGITKSQMLYILLGFYCFALIPLFFSIILPFFGILSLTWLDSFGTVPLVMAIGYAIFRYRLMDIRLIVVRSLGFGVIIIFITSIFAIISITIGDRLQNIIGIKSEILVGSIVGLLVTFTYQPIRRFAENATNRFLYKKRYNPDKLISNITEVTSSVLALDKLVEEISKYLSEAFHQALIGFALLDKKGKLRIRYSQGIEKEKAEALATDQEQVMFKEFQQSQGKILVIDELVARFEAGDYKPVNEKLLYALNSLDVDLIIPLNIKNKLIGIIALGAKKSGDLYNQQDLNVLDIIAGQTAIAIENAQLYDELRQFNITLQQKVDEATKDLRLANSRLRELDRNKSEFISIASHQLRTPLTVIKGYISMMREGSFGKVRPEIMSNLEKVYIANERLIGLVENLLDISRIESGRQQFTWEKARLEDLAQTVVEELSNNAKDKGLQLTFVKPAKATSQILADKNKLHEVMMNFVDNAIKYTEKGRIEVSVNQNTPGMVTFVVKDTGMGITKETIPYLFQKFSRGTGSFQVHTEGTGLGLYVARMIVEAHHGIISAESAGPNQGSRFFFEVPLAGPESKNYQAKEPITSYLGK